MEILVGLSCVQGAPPSRVRDLLSYIIDMTWGNIDEVMMVFDFFTIPADELLIFSCCLGYFLNEASLKPENSHCPKCPTQSTPA